MPGCDRSLGAAVYGGPESHRLNRFEWSATPITDPERNWLIIQYGAGHIAVSRGVRFILMSSAAHSTKRSMGVTV